MSPATVNSPNTTCERDVEGARQLLADAGWTDTNGDGTVDKDGVEMKLLFQTSINPLRQGEQAIVKQNLEEIGIDVELKAIDAGVFFGGDAGNPDTINKFYADLEMYANSPDSPNLTYLLCGLSVCQRGLGDQQLAVTELRPLLQCRLRQACR